MNLLYLRHGQTDWNAQNLLQGRSDIPLNETGREQARARAAELIKRQPPVEVIYASPLVRARETAEIIQQALGVPLHEEGRLIEQCFGELEGKDRAGLIGGSIISHYEALGEAAITRQGVESRAALYERVGGLLDELYARHAGQVILVVAHGGVARMVHWYYHGADELDKAKHGNAILRQYTAKSAGHGPPVVV